MLIYIYYAGDPNVGIPRRHQIIELRNLLREEIDDESRRQIKDLAKQLAELTWGDEISAVWLSNECPECLTKMEFNGEGHLVCQNDCCILNDMGDN